MYPATYGLPNHAKWGYSGEPIVEASYLTIFKYSQPIMWKPKDLPLGEIGVHTHSRCSPLNGGSSLQSALILVMPVSELDLDLNQFKNEATIIIFVNLRLSLVSNEYMDHNTMV